MRLLSITCVLFLFSLTLFAQNEAVEVRVALAELSNAIVKKDVEKVEELVLLHEINDKSSVLKGLLTQEGMYFLNESPVKYSKFLEVEGDLFQAINTVRRQYVKVKGLTDSETKQKLDELVGLYGEDNVYHNENMKTIEFRSSHKLLLVKYKRSTQWKFVEVTDENDWLLNKLVPKKALKL